MLYSLHMSQTPIAPSRARADRMADRYRARGHSPPTDKPATEEPAAKQAAEHPDHTTPASGCKRKRGGQGRGQGICCSLPLGLPVGTQGIVTIYWASHRTLGGGLGYRGGMMGWWRHSGDVEQRDGCWGGVGDGLGQGDDAGQAWRGGGPWTGGWVVGRQCVGAGHLRP